MSKNSLHLFEEQALAHPNRDALVALNHSLTYQSLNDQAEILKTQLLHSSLLDEELCFVYTHSSTVAIISIIGIFKAKKIFVPINPTTPKERIVQLYNLYAPKHVILDETSAKEWEEVQREINANKANILTFSGGFSLEEINTLDSTKELQKEYNPDDPCYVYFTSGSTGIPKGILGAYRGIDHFIQWELETIGASEPLRVTQFSPYSFDVFLRDVFVPLCSGGTIFIPPKKEGIIDVNAIPEWLLHHQISLMHCVPILFREIMKSIQSNTDLSTLKNILLAGEKLYWSDIKKWRSLFPNSTTSLSNIYGPSETSLAKFSYFINANEIIPDETMVSVGKPIPGSKAILLNDDLAPCVKGEVGEIFINTPYRSLGYYQNETLTAEKFIVHPKLPNAVLYRTGDLAFVNKEGNYVIVGRKDNQIKLRGVRVELSEIENALTQFEEVENAAVVYHEEKGLIGSFLVSKDSHFAENVRGILFEKLPMNLVPSHIKIVDQLPINTNGKIDRPALLKRFKEELEASNEQMVAPSSDIEKQMVRIWSEVLEMPQEDIGIEDNFFELGGHSMMMVKLKEKIFQELGKEVTLLELFRYPNIQFLSKFLSNEKDAKNTPLQENTIEEDASDMMQQTMNLFGEES